MSYYQSNYPSYGGGQNYGYQNSGPPPPPMSMGGYQQSAYNVNYNSYQMGSVPPPGHGSGYTASPYQALQNTSQCYNANPYQGQFQPQPPPPQPPQFNMDQYNRQMYENQWYAQQQMKQQILNQRRMEKQLARQQREEEDVEGEEQEEEEKLDEVTNEMMKAELKKIFVDELMRRLSVSGTFDMTEGTVHEFKEYTQDDPVMQYILKVNEIEDVGNYLEKKKNKKWDCEKDCEYLRSAMKGLGTDEEAITHVVTSRNNRQRQEMKSMFKTMYGRDLIVDLKSELSGDYKSAIMALFVPPAVLDAYYIKEAIYGPGTDEEKLLEILMTRTNPQIKEMREKYPDVASPHRKDNNSLIEKDIAGDTSGDFKRLLIAASQGNRGEISREQLVEAVEEITANGKGTGMYQVNYDKLADMDKARLEAKKLFKAGEDRWGTDEETFIKIFSVRDHYQLRSTWNEYVKICQRDITNSVDRETSGNFKRGLKAIVGSIKCRPKFFAERLKNAMKGLGTDDDTLIRIVVTRSEIDMVQIKKEFLDLTKQTLWNYIKNDTSGDYRKLLLDIVGRD